MSFYCGRGHQQPLNRLVSVADRFICAALAVSLAFAPSGCSFKAPRRRMTPPSRTSLTKTLGTPRNLVLIAAFCCGGPSSVFSRRRRPPSARLKGRCCVWRHTSLPSRWLSLCPPRPPPQPESLPGLGLLQSRPSRLLAPVSLDRPGRHAPAARRCI